MFGTLYVWGTDGNGFWKKRIQCYQSEVHIYLANINNYEDYDFDIKC